MNTWEEDLDLTKDHPSAPSRLNPDCNTNTWRSRRYPLLGNNTILTQSSRQLRLSNSCIAKASLNYLLGLADPPSFIFVRPVGPKRHLARVQKLFIHRVFQVIASIASITQLLLNRNIDRPATFGRELQVFHDGIVVFLPAVKVFIAKKAFHIIWI